MIDFSLSNRLKAPANYDIMHGRACFEGESLPFCAREALESCKIEGLDPRKENKMNYPVEYTVIAENEKIYIEAVPIIGGCSTTSSVTICGTRS